MVDFLIKLIIYIISILDKTERSDEKLIKSHILDGVQVLSDNGWSPAAYIHKTKPFEIYTLTTEKGKTLKCADEHIVFRGPSKIPVWVSDLKPGNYINTKDGLEKVVSVEKSDTKVCMCDITVLNEHESYYTNGILSHNTTTSAIFLLHYILFNIDKNSLVLGNKRKTAVEILDKLKKIFLELPYFLKPGVCKWNEGQIVLDNGCMCMAEATTINSGISFTFHCVLADEFAHIAPTILDKFYNNLFPTITAGKARFIISSTQNGYNLFYRLWCGSVSQENEYAPFKVDWWQVPEWNPEKQRFEKRDEEWHRRQIANYGGEENFNKQFGTGFDISSNTLVSSDCIKKMQEHERVFEVKDMPGIIGHEMFYWHPDFDPVEDLRKYYYAITIDIAEGVSNDYTTYIFNRIGRDSSGEITFECVGFFHCNSKEIQWCARVLRSVCVLYMDFFKYVISLEYNTYGELFYTYMKDEIDRDPANIQKFNEDLFVKFYSENRNKYTVGIKLNHQTKLKGCKLFKYDTESGRIVNHSHLYINELSNFCDAKGTNVYKASFGHDDIVMAQIQVEFAKESIAFKNLVEEMDLRKEIAVTNSSNQSVWSFGDPISWDTGQSDYNPEQNMYGDVILTNTQDALRRLM